MKIIDKKKQQNHIKKDKTVTISDIVIIDNVDDSVTYEFESILSFEKNELFDDAKISTDELDKIFQ